MTQPTESGQEQATSAQPTPKIASTSGAQPPSQSGNDKDELAHRLDQLEKFVRSELPEQLTRTAQSRHDKRIGRIESEIGALRADLEASGLKGPEVDAALGRMRYNKLEQAVEELASGGQTGTPHQPQAESFDESEARAIAEAHGLDYDDPAVLEWRNGTFASVKEARIALNKAIAGKSKPQTIPASAGTIVADMGGKPSVTDDEQTKLLKEMEKIPFGDSTSLYQMEREKLPKKGRRR